MLFDQPSDPKVNKLPYDGRVNYYGKVFEPAEAKLYKNLREEIAWENEEGHHIR